VEGLQTKFKAETGGVKVYVAAPGHPATASLRVAELDPLGGVTLTKFVVVLPAIPMNALPELAAEEG
jgi:hypothetical protein